MDFHSCGVYTSAQSCKPRLSRAWRTIKTFTSEVFMTDMDPVSARTFYRRPGDGKTSESAGIDMTDATGIRDINPRALIYDFVFEPYEYSMNGMDGDRYSTNHVTPGAEFSYVRYELVGSIHDPQDDVTYTLMKVTRVFRPGNMSVSTTRTSPKVWRAITKALELIKLKCCSYSVDTFLAVRVIAFHAFTSR